MESSAQSAVAVRLEDYEEGFLAGLARLGYASRSREAQRYLLRHLSRWLAMRGLALSELSEEVAGQYAAARRQERSHLRSGRALRPLLGYLRGLGVVPAAAAAVPESAGEVLLARFAAYLAGERGLAAATVSSYLSQVRPFVAAHADAGRWSALRARQVARFAAHSAAGLRPRSAQVRANALRALLGFMWQEGLTASALAGAVGSFAARPARPRPEGSARARRRAAGRRAGQRPGRGAERAGGGVDAAAGAAGRRGRLAAAGGHRLAIRGGERARQGEPPGSDALAGRRRAAAGQVPAPRAPRRDGAPAGVPGPGRSARAADGLCGGKCRRPRAAGAGIRARAPRTGCGTPRHAGSSQPAAGSPRPGSCCATPARRRPLSTPGLTSPRFVPSPGPGRGRYDQRRAARGGPRLPVRAPRPGLPAGRPRVAARGVPGRP